MGGTDVCVKLLSNGCKNTEKLYAQKRKKRYPNYLKSCTMPPTVSERVDVTLAKSINKQLKLKKISKISQLYVGTNK